MPDFLRDFFLAIAAATPLPPVEGSDTVNTQTALPVVQTRSQTMSRFPVTTPQALRLQPSVIGKTNTKKRKSPFTIFVDNYVSAAGNLPTPSPKRSRTNTPRTPLGERTDSANSTPRPSPRLPGTPFPFSPADHDWEDTENYAPAAHAAPMTPPETPRGPPLPPTTSEGPRPRRSARALRPRPLQSGRPSTMTPPVNMLAYQMMGLEDWNVSADAIKAAYRRKAPTLHPDKLPAQEKELATLDMQQLNAVRDMLLDARGRRQYHMDGEIPWVV
jgi:hypothetical protein